MLAVRLGDRRFSLRQAQTFVGRSRSCDIRIRSQAVSRLHTVLYWRDGELRVEDLGSFNGTYVNGSRLNGVQAVRPGDVVRFGDVAGEIDLERIGERPRLTTDSIPLSYPMLRPAPLLRRLAAMVADLGLFSIGSSLPLLPLLAAGTLRRFGMTPEWLPLDLQTRSVLAGVSLVLWLLFLWAYVIHAWARTGATPGMRLLGLRLVDWRGRHPVGTPRAWLRAVALVVTGLTLGLGMLIAAFRRDRRTLHDLLAGTWVAWNPFERVGGRSGKP